jgi:hypothetical protein
MTLNINGTQYYNKNTMLNIITLSITIKHDTQH